MLTDLDEKKPAPTVKKSWGGARPNTGGPRPGSGRKKGSPNKMTADIKAAIVTAKMGDAAVKDRAPEYIAAMFDALAATAKADGNDPIGKAFAAPADKKLSPRDAYIAGLNSAHLPK